MDLIIGNHGFPLSYLLRPLTILASPAPLILVDEPYSTEHGYMNGELIANAQHDHVIQVIRCLVTTGDKADFSDL